MRTFISTTAVAAAAALTLVGCGSIGDAVNDRIGDAINDGIENVVENQIGAEFELGGNLPANFPSEVPTPAGEITFSLGTGDDFIVYFNVDGANALEDYRNALESAGYTMETEMEQMGLRIYVYTGNGYNLNVAFVTAEGSDMDSIQLIVGAADSE